MFRLIDESTKDYTSIAVITYAGIIIPGLNEECFPFPHTHSIPKSQKQKVDLPSTESISAAVPVACREAGVAAVGGAASPAGAGADP